MENTWYYTLSTISQTLAAVLGLVAVFVVLRLQSLTKNVSDYKARALHILSTKKNIIPAYKISNDEIKVILAELKEFKENYESNFRSNAGILMEMGELSDRYRDFDQSNDIELVKDTFGKLNIYVSQRDGMIRLVKWPGIATSLAIILSLFFLAFSNQTIHLPTLWIIAGFAIFSLFSIIRASWKIIDAIRRLE